MLIRISLIVAIIAGIAIGVVNFVVVKEKVTTLQTNYKNEQDAHTKTRGELSAKTKELDSTKKELDSTKQELTTTKDDLGKAQAEAGDQKKRADKLSDELTKTRQDRDSAQQDLAAYKATGWTPERILGADKEIKGVQDKLAGALEENVLLGKDLRRTKTELAFYVKPDFHIELPAALKGKVLLPDPKWGFVLLNVGANDEVLPQSELLIHRKGTLVAKVQVTNVLKDRCVANVMPGWGNGEDIYEGDAVIPAYPKL